MRENKLVAFEGKDRRWYWKLLNANGETIAIGGQGFSHASNARRGFRSVQRVIIRDARARARPKTTRKRRRSTTRSRA